MRQNHETAYILRNEIRLLQERMKSVEKLTERIAPRNENSSNMARTFLNTALEEMQMAHDYLRECLAEIVRLI